MSAAKAFCLSVIFFLLFAYGASTGKLTTRTFFRVKLIRTSAAIRFWMEHIGFGIAAMSFAAVGVWYLIGISN